MRTIQIASEAWDTGFSKETKHLRKKGYRGENKGLEKIEGHREGGWAKTLTPDELGVGYGEKKAKGNSPRKRGHWREGPSDRRSGDQNLTGYGPRHFWKAWNLAAKGHATENRLGCKLMRYSRG